MAASKSTTRRKCALCGKSGAKYLGRVYWTEGGEQRTHHLGYFCTKAHRTTAREDWRREQAAQLEEAKLPAAERMTCRVYAERYLARYERERKDSSYDTARQSLKRFLAEFGDHALGSIARHEAIDWSERVPPSSRPVVVTMFNRAVDEELIDRNPFRGLGKRTKGRSDEAPPTPVEFDGLLDACSALGDYSPQMRALMLFAAYTGMRPGELFALEWTDIDFTANRVQVERRLYKGRVALPKSNKARPIALTPPARDVLLRLRALPHYRADESLVFRAKRGGQLSQSTMSGYWGKVLARASLDFDFYLATKHYGVHLLYKLGLSKRAIGAQMGWSEKAVEKLLTVYGHVDLVALEEVDALYRDNVVPLRPITDAQTDSVAADPAS
jgi:integrase